MSTIGGIIKGIERAEKLGYQCTQIYTTKSRSWDIGDACSENLLEYVHKHDVYLVAHIPMIVNLASSNNLVRKKSQKRLFQEIIRAHEYGIDILVLHPGSTVDGNFDRGINCVIESINHVANVCEEYNIVLAIETMSGQGTQLGSRFEELASILNGVKKNTYLGVCVDTCHLYAAGYDIANKDSLYNMMEQFDKIIGMEKIKVIHLNNTKVSRGKKTDRHSSIFEGNISLETFESIVCDQRFREIPIVLEPSSRDMTGPEQVQYLINISRENGYGN